MSELAVVIAPTHPTSPSLYNGGAEAIIKTANVTIIKYVTDSGRTVLKKKEQFRTPTQNECCHHSFDVKKFDSNILMGV